MASQNNDSLRIISHLNKARSVWYSNPDSGRLLVNQAIDLGKQSGYERLMAKSFNYLGIVYDIKDEYDSAMMYYNRAIPLARRLDDTITEAGAYNNIGLIEWNKGHFDKAIENYFRSLHLFEAIGKNKGIANTLNNIGLIYWEQERFDRAANYIKRSLKLRKNLDDTYGRSASYANLGLIYSDIDKLDSSKYYLKLAIDLKKELNDLKGLAIVYNNLAEVFGQTNQYDSGIVYLKQSIDLHLQLDDKRYLASNYASLGRHYYRSNQLDLAEETYLEGLKMAARIDALKEMLTINYRLGELYSEQGRYKESNQYLSTSLQLQDSLYNIEKEESIIEMQEKYETAKQEKELAEQRANLAESSLKIKNRNYLVYSLAGLLVFLIILAIILYRQEKFKQARLKKENALKDQIAAVEIRNKLNEQKIAISRDLHDNIGAQLTLISSMVDSMIYSLKDEDTSLNDNLRSISDFSHNAIRHLRDTVWAMKKEEISGQDLLSRMREFIQRANNAAGECEVDITTAGNSSLQLSSLEGINIYRMMQEGVNNAIKHAGASHIEVQLETNRGELKMEIRDDGKGFDLEKTLEQDGLSSLQSRAREINADLKINSSADSGTTVTINYPGK